MNELEKQVKVTHFINPNQFFYLELSREKEIEVLKRKEVGYATYCADREPKDVQIKPQPDDIVLYFSTFSVKWLRCIIDDVRPVRSYCKDMVAILWALDYGVPLATLKLDMLVPLAKESCSLKSPILNGSLNVLPAQLRLKKYNQVELVIQDRWSEDAVKFMEKCMKDSISVFFRKTSYINDEELVLGDLFVQKATGEMINLGRELVEQKLAVQVPVEKFIKAYNTSFTSIIERWNDRDRLGGVILCPDTVIVTDIAEHSHKEAPKYRHYFVEQQKLQEQYEGDVMIKESLDKVDTWIMRNEGVLPEEAEIPEDFHFSELAVQNYPREGLDFDEGDIEEPDQDILELEKELSEAPAKGSPSSIKGSPPQPINFILIPGADVGSPSIGSTSIHKKFKRSAREASSSVGSPPDPKLNISGSSRAQSLPIPITPTRSSGRYGCKRERTFASFIKEKEKFHEERMTSPELETEDDAADTTAADTKARDTSFEAFKLRRRIQLAAEAINLDEAIEAVEGQFVFGPSSRSIASIPGRRGICTKIMSCFQIDETPPTAESPVPEIKININDASAENWMSLEVGAEYPAIVSSFGSCSSFFIQTITDDDAWDEMMNMLYDIQILDPMQEIEVGKMCIVDFQNELNRAKIIRKAENSVMCFCVDTAELVYFRNEPERIYEIPDEILNFMPFQAINCRLNVTVPSNYAWTGTIYNKFIKRILKMKVITLCKLEKNPDMIPWGLQNVNSYEVTLIDIDHNNKETNVNEMLVKLQLAETKYSPES